MNTSAPPHRQLSILTSLPDLYSDSRAHGYQGPTRNVRLLRATPSGGGAIATSEDGFQCAVTGKESLRIMRLSEGSSSSSNNSPQEYKSFSVGHGGHRIDASRNFWEGSGLKIDSASTDVAWGYGLFNNKILTSARNGELIMWDLNKSGPMKYERRTKDHMRSIHKISVSHIIHHYCITGSADGDLRVWDLRDLSKSLMRIHHPTSVRGVVFSPSTSKPLQGMVGLDNGSIYRWDLQMAQRGQLDRLPVAHTAPVTTLDWCNASSTLQTSVGLGGTGDYGGGNGQGWVVSGSLDRSVKIWDLTTPGSLTHIPHKPTYTLHPSFPVRRVIWRPSYECEVAVVSNVEFATASSADISKNSAAGTTIHKAGGTNVLVPDMAAGLSGSVVFGHDSGGHHTASAAGGMGPAAKNTRAGISSAGGDAVEIWDVRRGWIAKWSLARSAVDGGVTDVAFRDSHAIWAQHSSGMFSQIDLRDSTKPLDAIPRVAVSWEASGTLSIVTDRKARWEVPYDDVSFDQRPFAEERKIKLKALGDSPCKPNSQHMDTCTSDYSAQDLEVFTKLARGYVFEGKDQPRLCAINAKVAFQAGDIRAAQTWLLLGASLTNIVPDLPPAPSRRQLHTQKPRIRPLPPSVSAPAAISTTYTFPSGPSLTKTSDSAPAVMQKTSPGRASIRSASAELNVQRDSVFSAPRKVTPTSSDPASPHNAVSATPRPSPLPGRRESLELDLIRHRSAYRRSSVSSLSIHSSSPSDKNTGRLRHIAEGALDDSDSSGHDGDNGKDTVDHASSGEESHVRPLTSPPLSPVRINTSHPSPLSRVAGRQQWTEDEADKDDEATSPSPGSTDTESEGSNSPRRRLRSGRRSRRNSHKKSRSRSSTVASLAAPSFPRLTHQESSSSIRTVTASEVPFKDSDSAKALKLEETNRDSHAASVSHSRQKSQTLSEFALDPVVSTTTTDEEEEDSLDSTVLTERRPEIVRAEEKKLREIGWDTLRQELEHYADEGNVQMCAMLSVVAARDLRIERKRVTRFLDAYIDLLTRLRLFTCTAYLRKYCETDARNDTLLETTIYTACGKCRKPLVVLPVTQASGEACKGAYSYCRSCKSTAITCAICRLPVSALLFQCSVCTHGGHQACYRQYYMGCPMVELPYSPPSLTENKRHSIRSSSSIGSAGDDTDSVTTSTTSEIMSESEYPTHVGQNNKLVGYPCAAGCGHFCWAATGSSEET